MSSKANNLILIDRSSLIDVDGLRDEADAAYVEARWEDLRSIGNNLLALDRPNAEGWACYYRALYLCKVGAGNKTEARRFVERAYALGDDSCKARSLISLGSLAWRDGEDALARRIHLEARKIIRPEFDPLARYFNDSMLAILDSCKGDHKASIARLVSLNGAVQRLRVPGLYYDHLNSLAVEKAALGSVTEAQAMIDLVIASPYAHNKPSWHETQREISALIYKPSCSSIYVPEPMLEPKPTARIIDLNRYRLTRQIDEPARTKLFRLVLDLIEQGDEETIKSQITNVESELHRITKEDAALEEMRDIETEPSVVTDEAEKKR